MRPRRRRSHRRPMVDRIILVGMMGAGKTTVGSALAGRLGWRPLRLRRPGGGGHRPHRARAVRRARRGGFPGRGVAGPGRGPVGPRPGGGLGGRRRGAGRRQPGPHGALGYGGVVAGRSATAGPAGGPGRGPPPPGRRPARPPGRPGRRPPSVLRAGGRRWRWTSTGCQRPAGGRTGAGRCPGPWPGVSTAGRDR